MVRVLERAGCAVEFPEGQTCCGQPAFSTGHWSEARPLALRFAQVFAGYDSIVCGSGSCTTMVRRFFPMLAHGDAEVARALAPLHGHVFEFSEFLVKKLGVSDVGASFPYRVAFHDGCHQLRELGIHDEPRQLLRAVRGLELVEMDEQTECCGFGGGFSVQNADISAALGQRKAANVERADVDYVTSCDPSCLMQIGGTLARQPGRAQAIHIAEILATAAAEPATKENGARAGSGLGGPGAGASVSGTRGGAALGPAPVKAGAGA